MRDVPVTKVILSICLMAPFPLGLFLPMIIEDEGTRLLVIALLVPALMIVMPLAATTLFERIWRPDASIQEYGESLLTKTIKTLNQIDILEGKLPEGICRRCGRLRKDLKIFPWGEAMMEPKPVPLCERCRERTMENMGVRRGEIR